MSTNCWPPPTLRPAVNVHYGWLSINAHVFMVMFVIKMDNTHTETQNAHTHTHTHPTGCHKHTRSCEKQWPRKRGEFSQKSEQNALKAIRLFDNF